MEGNNQLSEAKISACKKLYPKECYRNSKSIYFEQLPMHLSKEIHYMRDIADLILTEDDTKRILGYGITTAHDEALDLALAVPMNSGPLHRSLLHHHVWDTKSHVLDAYPVAFLFAYKVPLSYMLMNEMLQHNKAICRTALMSNPMVYQLLPPVMKEELDLVLICVQKTDQMILHIPEKLRSDRDMALKMVSVNGLILPYLSPILRSDVEIVNAALHENLERMGF